MKTADAWARWLPVEIWPWHRHIMGAVISLPYDTKSQEMNRGDKVSEHADER